MMSITMINCPESERFVGLVFLLVVVRLVCTWSKDHWFSLTPEIISLLSPG